ncbi:dymeclin [Brachionus plicatilis]|uniref:Dymeclin n=1 Tax=Brachionus plicatilis TaxID=10195 RepID=A0A3M7T3Y6_BRAPC|nr:dymeclin [Brachionus plicatilis]
MYSKTPAYESVIFDTVMQKMDRFVSDFVKVLLKNLIQQMPPPSSVQNLSSYLSNEVQNQRSFMSSVASGLWSVMTLGLGSANLSTDQNNLEDENEKYFLPSDSTTQNTDDQLDCSSRYVAWQSCHILLVLSNNYTNESLYNPYRLALFHFTDTQNTPTNLPNSEPLPWFSIDFSKLFQMFTHTVHTDQYSLLLYMLLHRNQHFKMFILSRLQIDLLVMPLLKVIFTAPERNSHHIYMTLIIILILSEDDIFNKSAHTIPIKKLTWYTERSLSEISLGGLLILVLIRTIQFNMTRMRDKYLHTNCLAALANMSSKFQNLHPYVCQRINSLFNMLTRKRTKIITQINEENSKPDAEKNDNNNKDLLQDLSIIEELMKMVLEIINSCLTNNLHHNSDLIYSILYHKTIYLQFRDHPTFQDLTQNIDTVITRFSHEIEIVEDKTIENLRELITMGAKQFSRERFRKFPELKFKYVEEDQPEEFFVPYVWSLVYKYSSLYWIDHSVDLFNSSKNQ